MENLYYTEPSDGQFEELKTQAIEIWNTYSNRYGYVNEKVGQIKDLKNFKDNFMFMVAMFDTNNQKRLANSLSEKTKKAIRDRIVAGGDTTGGNFK